MTCFHLEGRNCEVFDVLFSWVYVRVCMSHVVVGHLLTLLLYVALLGHMRENHFLSL